MKTLLIPCDFSPASSNAIQYVSALNSQSKFDRIILLHSFNLSVFAEIMPSADFIQYSSEDIASEIDARKENIEKLASDLRKKVSKHALVEATYSDLPLLRAINSKILQEQCSMVIIGTDNNGEEPGESYISQQAVEIVKSCPVPIMVIPIDTTYQFIKKALVPCDLSSISSFELLKNLRKIKGYYGFSLQILHVDIPNGDQEFSEENLTELEGYLQNYQYHIHHTKDESVINGILTFVKQYAPQLIIALPGQHSFFYRMTHKSINAALARHAHIPVLMMKKR